MDAYSPFLGPEDIAKALGIKQARAYQLIAAGVVPSVRIAGRIRIPRLAWNAWLKAQAAAALAAAHREPERLKEEPREEVPA